VSTTDTSIALEALPHYWDTLKPIIKSRGDQKAKVPVGLVSNLSNAETCLDRRVSPTDKIDQSDQAGDLCERFLPQISEVAISIPYVLPSPN